MERCERQNDGTMLLCRRKNKLEFGFSLIEMIVCLFLLSIFFLLFPRLHFIEMENKQSKGLNDWEWDVYLGQMQLEFREVSSGEQLAFENGESILQFRSRNGSEVSYEKENSRLIRKVDRRGREVVLQNIGTVSYKLTPHVLIINVKDTSGKIYEGVVMRYSEIGINV
ncbi:MAG TPA: prepilin-type N-terminal cleavage/methylation domain-containing protein [Bacillus sp. (in: Bacteria)]|uniref:Competence protein ComG n=4 Tax=Bacillus cereus group TaxID=86661 RepID=A0A9X7B9U3_BACCE|nr:competence protein ComG [Bacillus thuringiensis]OTX92569.1 competence protein ComG [Bacillus thuringiensis serovar londrina]OTY54240.1 competence protein ComG [Bacillus thuringiensis serovar yosoo]PEB35727.1 competence protein ComG [Bacillus cereus]PKS17921.1 prepilin-type N-terminal cleavage/methylation domain-containing protein [Bacillus sp. BI3]HCF55514.1 prepilin-type N-terminal cleavage/methylation domain-containing protein [Bacillus sp. (in: firmicutes)]